MSIPNILAEKDYTIVKSLGNGGQSHTCIVKKEGVEWLLKQPSSINLSKEQRFRFKQEAEALQMLHGNGTPLIFEYKFDNNEPYILMELILGKTLGDVVAGKALDNNHALNILTKLSSILSRIHNLGMQHRDIKPDNIIIKDNGDVYLIDFGLCRLENEIKDYRTPNSKELGNRFLRLPELGKGEKVSSSVSDVTFLVGIYFYMITGRQPYLLLDEFNHPPHRRVNTIELFENTSWLRQIFDKGFAYPIGQRFQSVEELINFITDIQIKPIMTDEDNPLAEFEAMINSPKHKSLNEIIEFVFKAHKIFTNSARKEFSPSIDVAEFGPDTDKTGYSVISRFFISQKGRLHPDSFSILTTIIDKDLSTISYNYSYQNPKTKVKSYSVSEQERILQEYEELGKIRGKEALRVLIELIKKE